MAKRYFICRTCQKTFTPKNYSLTAKFCSVACQFPKQDFWSHVEKTDSCWLWTRHTSHRFGYGFFCYQGVSQNAHRVSWQLKHGDIPKGMCVLHRCDVPSCVNPDHLFLGTRGDNNSDRLLKGRNSNRKGAANPACKLRPKDIRAIRVAHGSNREVASQFDISHSTVSQIRHGKLWGWLT